MSKEQIVVSKKSRLLASIFALFLWPLGIHNFYLAGKRGARNVFLSTAMLVFLAVDANVAFLDKAFTAYFLFWIAGFLLTLLGFAEDGDGIPVKSWIGGENKTVQNAADDENSENDTRNESEQNNSQKLPVEQEREILSQDVVDYFDEGGMSVCNILNRKIHALTNDESRILTLPNSNDKQIVKFFKTLQLPVPAEQILFFVDLSNGKNGKEGIAFTMEQVFTREGKQSMFGWKYDEIRRFCADTVFHSNKNISSFWVYSSKGSYNAGEFVKILRAIRFGKELQNFFNLLIAYELSDVARDMKSDISSAIAHRIKQVMNTCFGIEILENEIEKKMKSFIESEVEASSLFEKLKNSNRTTILCVLEALHYLTAMGKLSVEKAIFFGNFITVFGITEEEQEEICENCGLYFHNILNDATHDEEWFHRRHVELMRMREFPLDENEVAEAREKFYDTFFASSENQDEKLEQTFENFLDPKPFFYIWLNEKDEEDAVIFLVAIFYPSTKFSAEVKENIEEIKGDMLNMRNNEESRERFDEEFDNLVSDIREQELQSELDDITLDFDGTEKIFFKVFDKWKEVFDYAATGVLQKKCKEIALKGDGFVLNINNDTVVTIAKNVDDDELKFKLSYVKAGGLIFELSVQPRNFYARVQYATDDMSAEYDGFCHGFSKQVDINLEHFFAKLDRSDYLESFKAFVDCPEPLYERYQEYLQEQHMRELDNM